MRKYRKKPVVIEAEQVTQENVMALARMVGARMIIKGPPIPIRTLEGVMMANAGDWIIKGVAGEYYPCKPEIFEATYEAIGE